MHAFYDVTACRLVYSYRRFGLYCYLYPQCPYLLVMLRHNADDMNLGHHRYKINSCPIVCMLVVETGVHLPSVRIYMTHITRYLRVGDSLLLKVVTEDCIFLPSANMEPVEWLATYCRGEIHFSKGQKFFPFLVASAKLRKATISFIMSVCLSTRPYFRMKQLGAHWTDFHEF
jgi:hypothetical protein